VGLRHYVGAISNEEGVISSSYAQGECGSTVATREAGNIAKGNIIGESLEHCLREWENIVAFKSVIMSKAKLCEERHCKRNKVKLKQKRCYKRNITNVSLLQHVSFLFFSYAVAQASFFLTSLQKKTMTSNYLLSFFFSFLIGFFLEEDDGK
jgi:hypothetical protein